MVVRKNLFGKALQKANNLVHRLDVELQGTERLAAENQIAAAYELSLRAAETSERLTLVTRTLPAYTGSPSAQEDTTRVISDSIPVEIGFTREGWFSIRIPTLLPKKSEGSASYVRSYLYPAMKHFFSCVAPVRYEDCVLTFRHVYDENRPERQYRDHDNIEVNMVTDIVALYVLPDDAPLRCRHYYCSAAGPQDRTEVYVVPRKDFPHWLAIEKTFPPAGVKLYSECPRPP